MTLPPPASDGHPVDLGARTEAVVLAELIKRGYWVLVPFGHNQRYDLVLDLDSRTRREQWVRFE